MSDSSFERTVEYRLSSAYDCWGTRRMLRRGIQHGIWFLDPSGLDEPVDISTTEPTDERRQHLATLRSSGYFTATELATLDALVLEGLTIDEIAARCRCSRQAIVARLLGNSRGQGGILKKARRLLLREAPLNE